MTFTAGGTYLSTAPMNTANPTPIKIKTAEGGAKSGEPS